MQSSRAIVAFANDGETASNHYTYQERREVLERVAVDGCKPTARVFNIPLGRLKEWRKKVKLLFELKWAQTRRKSKITFERDLVIFMQDVRREEECEIEQGAWLQMYLSDISSHETRSCDYVNEIDAPSVLLLDKFDSHVSEAGQNIVAEETPAIVRPVPANSTSVSQPLDVGVMVPLKRS
ncbi:LOW QUALITY PROTEIN: hypothetical protein PHMEG_00013976, partial [Phytophthora megakarya]